MLGIAKVRSSFTATLRLAIMAVQFEPSVGAGVTCATPDPGDRARKRTAAAAMRRQRFRTLLSRAICPERVGTAPPKMNAFFIGFLRCRSFEIAFLACSCTCHSKNWICDYSLRCSPNPDSHVCIYRCLFITPLNGFSPPAASYSGPPLKTLSATVRCDEFAHKRSCPDRKSTRLNSSHQIISYAVFCLKKKKSR